MTVGKKKDKDSRVDIQYRGCNKCQVGKQQKSRQIARCTWHVSENVMKINKTDSNETIKECYKKISHQVPIARRVAF